MAGSTGLRRKFGSSMAIVGALALVVGAFVAPASADHEQSGVEPILYNETGPEATRPQNPTCEDIAAAEDLDVNWTEYKINQATPPPGEYGEGTFVVQISYVSDSDQKLMIFEVTSDHEVGAVVMKAQGANVYLYYPDNVTTDTHLHTPEEKEISHVSFCFFDAETETDPDPDPSVSIEKTPDDGTVTVGSPISFTIVVTAGGDADSTDVEVTDELPAAFDWSIADQDDDKCEITGDQGEQTLTCDLGTMEPGDSYEVIVTASTEGAACGVVNNTAEVTSADTEGDSDTGSVTITGCNGGSQPPPITPEEEMEETPTPITPEVDAGIVVPEPEPEETTTTTEEEVEEEVAGVEVARELPRTGNAIETGTMLVFAGLALLLGGLALGFADRATPVGRRID